MNTPAGGVTLPELPEAVSCTRCGSVPLPECNSASSIHGPLYTADQMREYARAALAGEWRDISSAPRDGTVVLLANAAGAWVARHEPVYPSGYRPDNPWFSLMLNRDYMPMDGRYGEATHWMPLPAAPLPKEPGR